MKTIELYWRVSVDEIPKKVDRNNRKWGFSPPREITLIYKPEKLDFVRKFFVPYFRIMIIKKKKK